MGYEVGGVWGDLTGTVGDAVLFNRVIDLEQKGWAGRVGEILGEGEGGEAGWN